MDNYQTESRQWWVEKWLELLDSYRFKKRLERARIYAREGHILSVEFEGSQVIAKVEGSEPQPYEVKLSLTPFRDEDWQFVIESLAKKAVFSAQLLAGKMPDNIEIIFTENGLNIFPFTLADIHSRCSCPDKANPCKHIGAIYYQLAERFSEDPFILFQLRGRTKEQILLELRQYRSESLNIEDTQNSITKSIDQEIEKKTLNLAKFWQYKELLDPSLVVITPSNEPQKVTNLLGTIPLPYKDGEAVKQYLNQAYKTASSEIIQSVFNNN
jgi:uncharacterized Zn finger protein